MVFTPASEARGFTQLHGTPAYRRSLRARLAGDQLLSTGRRSGFELHGGDGRLGNFGLRPEFLRAASRLAATWLRFLFELMVSGEFRSASKQFWFLVPRQRKRRR